MEADEKTALKELYHILVEENNAKTLPYIHVLGELIGQNSDITTLKSLLASDTWPQAIDKNLICQQDSEIDKISRAEGILELLVEKDLTGKKFLDFGCGEGHVAYKAMAQEPLVSVGYDIDVYDSWSKFNGDRLIFTSDFEEVKNNAPYDIVLIYDVIDHMDKNQSIQILKNIRDLLSDNGTIYLRTHPFCSRHATHLYHSINKAFIHLVFNVSELQEMGYEAPETAKIVFPIAQYGEIIKQAGLAISHSNIIREKVEPFFKKNTLIKERIRMHFKDDSSDKNIKAGGFPEFQCEQQFLDFVIKKDKK